MSDPIYSPVSSPDVQYNMFCTLVEGSIDLYNHNPFIAYRRPCLYLDYPYWYYAERDESKNELYPFDETKVHTETDYAKYSLLRRFVKSDCNISDMESFNKSVPPMKRHYKFCRWCGEKIFTKDDTRRPQLYCSEKCKQRDKRFKQIYPQMLAKAKEEDVFNILTFQRIEYTDYEEAIFKLNIMYEHYLIVHRAAMVGLRGNCRYCGKPIPPDKAFSAQYCSPECSAKGRKLKYYYSKKERGVKS